MNYLKIIYLNRLQQKDEIEDVSVNTRNVIKLKRQDSLPDSDNSFKVNFNESFKQSHQLLNIHTTDSKNWNKVLKY